MAKTLCDWSKKKRRKKWDKYLKRVLPVAFVCRKCGRAASDRKYLCSASQVEPPVVLDDRGPPLRS